MSDALRHLPLGTFDTVRILLAGLSSAGQPAVAALQIGVDSPVGAFVEPLPDKNTWTTINKPDFLQQNTPLT